jgi:predicted amidohydrolase YtcJ
MPAESRLYFGGEIHSVDAAAPHPEAVAIDQGRILAVGSERACRSALEMGGGYREVDLRGRALLPGFIDTHLHPIMMLYFEMNADLAGVESIGQLQQRLREAARGRSPGDWVVGLRFEDQELDAPRLPSRHDLDRACPERPALVVKHDGHMVIANTRAIEAAGLHAGTPDPEGGTIDREEGGYPSGIFREAAAALALAPVPTPAIEALRASARSCFGRLASFGITSAGAILQTDEEGPAGAPGALESVAMQLLLDEMPLGLYCILIGSEVEKVLAARRTALADEAAGHRVGGLKIYSDGTFGSCTACMREPFDDQPDRSGFLTLDEEEIYRRMRDAHRAGLQIAIHAIGDEANRRCIDLYQRLLVEYPRRDHRHRIEHASLLDGEMIARMARLGLVVSTQPLFIPSEKGWLHQRLGPERARMVYPLRSLLEAGVVVAGASDAPVESPDVLHAIQCCVTREGFERGQVIRAEQAVRMYTLDAAYAQFQESEKGSISPGKRADLVVLSANPVSVPAEEIREIRVEETLVGGEVVYSAAR